jgi:hypothetical protein
MAVATSPHGRTPGDLGPHRRELALDLAAQGGKNCVSRLAVRLQNLPIHRRE